MDYKLITNSGRYDITKWRMDYKLITHSGRHDITKWRMDYKLITNTVKNGIFKKILILQIKTSDLSKWNWEVTVELNTYVACFVTNKYFCDTPIQSIF